MPVNLGEMLLQEKMLTPEQLQEALNHREPGGGSLWRALLGLGFVKDEDITGLLSRRFRLPSANLSTYEVDPAVIKIVPDETAMKWSIWRVSRRGVAATFLSPRAISRS